VIGGGKGRRRKRKGWERREVRGRAAS